MTPVRIPPIQCLLTFEALARLRQFTEAYPEIDVTLQVSIPLQGVVAEDADLIGALWHRPLCRCGACVPDERRGHAAGLARV